MNMQLCAGGRATGVRLRPRTGADSADVVTATKAVVSNASVWDTQRLLPQPSPAEEWRREAMHTPSTDSFMHLHLGGGQHADHPAETESPTALGATGASLTFVMQSGLRVQAHDLYFGFGTGGLGIWGFGFWIKVH